MHEQQARLDFIRVIDTVNVDIDSLFHPELPRLNQIVWKVNCVKFSMPVRDESQPRRLFGKAPSSAMLCALCEDLGTSSAVSYADMRLTAEQRPRIPQRAAEEIEITSLPGCS